MVVERHGNKMGASSAHAMESRVVNISQGRGPRIIGTEARLGGLSHNERQL